MQRLLDIFFSGLALVLFSPLLIPIVIGLRLTGEGEIFYVQQRVGKDGKLFGLLKFATMLKDSPNLGTGLITTKNDPRVTPMGGFLRRTKINELPQLLNIFFGTMSVIGPRPQAEGHFDVFPEHVKKEIIKVKPGLSGIGSIVFRDEETIIENSPLSHEDCYNNVIAPYKGELEIWYINNQSLYLYLSLIFLTIWVVLNSESDLVNKMFPNLPPMPKELVT